MKHITIIFTLFILIISMLYAEDSIKVQAGWNNIGAKTTKLLSQITSIPPGIVTSLYFGYSPTGYTATDTLREGKGYWVKTTQAGVLKWDSSPSAPCAGTTTVTYESKTYNTVEIGTQCWLKENLDVGTMIQGSDTSRNNGIMEKYCYDNNTANCMTYGGLYTWDEAMQYSTSPGTQGICPTGWHIPTYAELMTLSISVNTNANDLKAIGQGSGSGAGTNTSGFSSLFSGDRYGNGNFSSIGGSASYRSSTQCYTTNAYELSMIYDNSGITFSSNRKDYGFSIRCLKN